MNSSEQPTLPNGVTCPPGGWTHKHVCDALNQVFGDCSVAAERTTAGYSAEGRAIEMVRLGAGKTRVIAWSQMHGDEHTYTTVVLNLLQLLVGDPGNPRAELLLKNLDLRLIPMLNPDGAERGVRFNAHGIDINRDARELATPEGQLLRRVITEFSPQYAFNLHNQNPRRLLPHSPYPIALSVLVPPADPQNSQTAGVLAATQVLSRVCQVVASECPGRVSRYRADYMPRCFGEWAQSQGVATMLLEAGGAQGDDIQQLERQNFRALLTGLEAIADPSQAPEDMSTYGRLPFAMDCEAFDLLVRSVRIHCGPATQPVVADIGVNRPNKTVMPPCPGTGVIEDIGDLREHGGLVSIDGSGMIATPGGIQLVSIEDNANRDFLDQQQEQAARSGCTTLLVQVDGSCASTLDWVREVTSGAAPLINVGFVGLRDRDQATIGDQQGLLLVSSGSAIPEGPSAPATVQSFLSRTLSLASRWGLGDYHEIDRGALANFVLAPNPDDDDQQMAPPEKVVVGGSLVLSGGELVERHAGAWLCRGVKIIANRKPTP